jgi:ABC-type amino acid transport system permease subunit
LLFSFSISLLLLAIAMSVAMIRPDTKSPAVLLTPSLYGPNSLSFTSSERMSSVLTALLSPPGIGTTCLPPENFIAPHTKCINEFLVDTQIFSQQCQCSDFHWTCEEDQTKKEEINLLHMNTTDTVYLLPREIGPNSWILGTHYEFIEKLYGGWSFNGNNHFVYYNNKGFHTPAAYLNALSNARLRSLTEQLSNSESSSYGISTYNHPFHKTDQQVKAQTMLQLINDYTLALLLVAVISFVPSRTIIYFITERTSDEKQVQKSFQVRTFEYWLAALIWDSFISILYMALAAVIIAAFGVKALSNGSNLPAALLLIFFYCLCMNCAVYLLEKLFQEPSLGQIVTLTVAVFIGISTLILMLLLFFFWWLKPIVEARKLLNIIFLLLPPFAAGKKVDILLKYN